MFFTSNYPSPLNQTAHQVCQDHQEAEIIHAIAFEAKQNFFDSDFYREKYLKKRFHVFSSIPEWKDFASQFDLSLGYRVHGCILSLNSGCLSVCCSGDSRAKEMCELLKIPYMPALNPQSDMVELYDSIDVSDLNTSYPRLYGNFASFIKRNCDVEIYQEAKITIQKYGGG